MENLLVVGGTGYIGYHLLKTLSKYKISLFSISLHPPKKNRKINNVTYLICDYTKKIQLKKINLEFNYVINASGYFYPKEKNLKRQNHNHHYLGLKNLINHFSQKKIRKFLHIGSSLEYGYSKILCKESRKCDPLTDYGKIKLKCTKFLTSLYKKNKYPICVVRLFSLYGGLQSKGLIINLLNFIKNKSNKSFIISNKYLDLCHIDDTTKGIIKLLFLNKSRGKIFNLGSGNLISTSEIKNIIKKKINRNKHMFKKVHIKFNNDYSICPDINKIKKMIKWKPKKNFLREITKIVRTNTL
jgi:nucleoside-diphosphate-sugar epimerase